MEREEIITMVQHLRQAEMAHLKVDATYAEIGDTKAISVQSETKEMPRMNKNKQNTQNMNNPTNTNHNANSTNNLTNTDVGLAKYSHYIAK